MVANSVVKPRVLIVSRRTVRKNKFVDFVGMSFFFFKFYFILFYVNVIF